MKLKSSTPDFINNIQKSMGEFIKKTEKEKENYLEILTTNVQVTYDKIKTGIKKGSKDIQNDIKNLIEKTTETAKALSYELCSIKKEEYDQCGVNKKKFLVNIDYNFKYFLFLVISLTENPDSIEKGMSQIIYDIIICLQEKFKYLWPSINAILTSKLNSLYIKQDFINLLAKSISNFVTFIKFEEHYGFLKKEENLTGLIKNENTKKVYKNIFKII